MNLAVEQTTKKLEKRRSNTATNVLLFLSIHTVCANTNTFAASDVSEQNGDMVQAYEHMYGNFSKIESPLNTHIAKKILTENPSIFRQIDFNLMSLAQNFSKEQVTLEADFTQVLNEVTFKLASNKPSKPRF